jgi:hypothetical protein
MEYVIGNGGARDCYSRVYAALWMRRGPSKEILNVT